jgi:protein gp37
MSENTKIEWCDATVNHWTVCTPVSPACDNCYAKAMAKRLWGVDWGLGVPRHRFSNANTTLKALDRKAQRLGLPLRVFHNSLSDFFDNEVPVRWRYEAMRAIVDTPNLIHLLLTKRIGNAAEMLEQCFRAVHGQREGWVDNVPPNVWLGATVCNQTEADRDIPKLLAVPAAKRFLSMEPLLGPVNLKFRIVNTNPPAGIDSMTPAQVSEHAMIIARAIYHSWCDMVDWVIVGGESGPNARPMHPDWARSLRDQCQAAGVPFLFKQWGEWVDERHANLDQPVSTSIRRTTSKLTIDGCVVSMRNPWPESYVGIYRVGKKSAGRLLDGRVWDEVPV